MKPVVFVPGLPGSELFDSATGERLFLNLGGLLSTTARPRFLARLEGPPNPDQDDGVVAGEPIADVLDLDLFDLGKQAQSLYDILDLRAPGPVLFPFQTGGRGEVAVPRNRIRSVQGGRLLRFQLSIEWDGGAKGPLTFTFQR